MRSPTTERQAREEEALAWARDYLQTRRAFQDDDACWWDYLIGRVSEILAKEDDPDLHDYALAGLAVLKRSGKRPLGRPRNRHRDFVLVILVQRLCKLVQA